MSKVIYVTKHSRDHRQVLTQLTTFFGVAVGKTKTDEAPPEELKRIAKAYIKAAQSVIGNFSATVINASYARRNLKHLLEDYNKYGTLARLLLPFSYEDGEALIGLAQECYITSSEVERLMLAHKTQFTFNQTEEVALLLRIASEYT